MKSNTPVQIELTSSVDGEVVRHRYDGDLYRKGQAVYVRYIEHDETGTETRTLLKLTEQEIKLTRRGQVESEQSFALQERRRGYYQTSMGRLPLVTETLAMEVVLGAESCSAVWSYSLHIADEPAGLFKLKIMIREV